MAEPWLQHWHNRVYNLHDRDLVIALHAVSAKAPELELPLNARELEFCSDLVKCFRQYPSITWRQRRWARQILIKSAAVLEHRALLDKELDDALARSS